MTRITIDRSKNKYTIEASGHSGYAEAGKDIVCAAVSTLMFSFLNFMDQKDIDYKIEYSDGYMKIEVENYKKIKDVIFFIESGFSLLQENYFENISLKWGIK